MAYTFTPTRLELQTPGDTASTEEWRRRMAQIGQDAIQGAINSYNRSSVDLANAAAANEQRGLRSLSDVNSGFANEASRLALQNQFRLDNLGQQTAAQNSLANSFEQQRQAALGLDLNAQQAAANNALAQWQANEGQRQFNEGFRQEAASNLLNQQTQTQNNELSNAQLAAQIEQFNKTFGLEQAGFNNQQEQYNWIKEMFNKIAASKPSASVPAAPNTPNVEGTSGGSTSTESSTSSGSVTRLPNGQVVVNNPPQNIVGSPTATQTTPTTQPTYTPEVQVQTYTGAKGLVPTLAPNVKSWEAFMQRAAKQLNVPSLSEVLSPSQLQDVKTKFSLFIKRKK